MDTTQFMILCDGIPAKVIPDSRERGSAQLGRVVIQEALAHANTCIPYSDVIKLRTGFIYLNYIDKSKDYAPYYYILEKISEYFNDATQQIAAWSEQAWNDVIAYCKSLPDFPKTNAFTNEYMRPRERERAMAATRLRKYGVEVTVKDCELKLSNIECVYARIEELATEIGGVRCIELMLEELNYDKEIGRYIVPHQGNQPMPHLIELEKPYGYLFNLCVKHIKDRGNVKESHRKWEELSDITTALCLVVYDSQKFNIWGDVLFRPEEVINVVHKLVLRFNIYTLPQTNVSFTLNWCRFLIRQTLRDKRSNSLLNEELRGLEKVMNWAVKASDNKRCKRIKKSSKECRCLDFHKGFLGDILVKKACDLNTEYVMPVDYDKVNSMMFPIVEGEEEYIFLPTPLVIWSWYEAIYNTISKHNKKIRNDIGYVMEDFVRNRMRTHGITAFGGDYSYKLENLDVDGEVDFLIEANEADAYIESKKKSFTRNARKGDDYYIWGDLYEFIYSQMQCARLENGVKKFGPITMIDGKTASTHTYIWKDKYHDAATKKDGRSEKKRYVVKVTMTLKEYGPMQDKVVLARIIESLVGRKINAEFAASDTEHDFRDQKEIQTVFEKINDALLKMMEYYKNMGDRYPTFFCRFYSMEQVYFLINIAKNQEHFVKLLAGSNVTVGTENFWNEYILVGRNII